MIDKDLKKEVDTLKAVHQALKKEKAKEPKDKTHYKIYRIEKDEKTGEEKKITMTKFWAKDDAEAYEELKKYRKVANKAYTYYYATTGYYIGNSLDEDGKVKRYDDLKEMMADRSGESIFESIKDAALSPFEWIWDKAKDFRYWTTEMVFFLRNDYHRRCEHWSLDSHMVDDIIFNIPLLIKNRHGVPSNFCAKARAKLNEKNPKFNLEKSLAEKPESDDKELELAGKMWDEELEKVLLYAKLYKFYEGYGIVDEKDPEQVEFAKTWGKTIPYKPGTHKDIDLVKLRNLENKHWNSLWNWIKENGRNLWD